MSSDRFLINSKIPEDLPTLELEIKKLKEEIDNKTQKYQDLSKKIEEFKVLGQSETENIPPLKAVALMADRLAPKLALIKQLEKEKKN